MKSSLLASILILSISDTPAQGAGLKAVAVSPDRSLVAAGGTNGVVVWETKTSKVIGKFSTTGTVQCLGFVKDSRTVVVGLDSKGAEAWIQKAGVWMRAAHFAGDGTIYALAIPPSGKEVAIASDSGWTYLYETEKWHQTGVLWERANLTSGIAFSPDGSGLASAGNSFSMWDLRTASGLRKARADRSYEELEATSKKFWTWSRAVGEPEVDVYCSDITFSADGKRVAGTTGVGRHFTGGKRLFVLEASTGRDVWVGRGNGMLTVTYAAEGTALVTGSDDGKLRVWHPENGKMLREWRRHEKSVRQVAQLGGKQFVSVGEDGKVIAWDVDSGELVARFVPDK
jgi:WD40 repeat protein